MPDTMPTQAQAIWLRSTRCPKAGDPPGQIKSSPADAGEFSLNAAAMGELRAAHPRRKEAPSRRAVLAELCLRQLLNLHAPAAVLCNARRECLYSYGPTGSYLRLAPSHSTPDVVAMAPGAMRTRVRSALGRALRDHARVVVPGGHRVRDGHSVPFNIDVQPLQGGGEALLLVCFVDAPAGPQGRRRGVASQDAPRIAELEQELEAMRAELAKNAQSAIAGQMSTAVQARLPLPQAGQEMTADAIDLIEQASPPRQVACMPGECGEAHRRPHAATASDHGPGPSRASQQEHRRRPWREPAHGREPPHLDHEADRVKVASGTGPIGGGGREYRRGSRTARRPHRKGCTAPSL